MLPVLFVISLATWVFLTPPKRIVFMNGAKYLSNLEVISPFSLERPVINAPPFEGTISVVNIPEHWGIELAYSYKEEYRQKLEDDAQPLLTLRTALHYGVTIPAELFTTKQM